jgi:hypothetical protein
MKNFGRALVLLVCGFLNNSPEAIAATLTNSNIDTRIRVAQVTFDDLTFSNAAHSSRTSLFFRGNVGDSGSFNISVSSGFQSFAYFSDAGILLSNTTNPTPAGNPGVFTTTITGTTNRVAGYDVTRLASLTPSIFALRIVNGFYTLELTSSSTGFLRTGGTFIESIVLPGNWSSHGVGTGQSELLSNQGGFTVTKDFVFDPVANATVFERVNNNYSGLPASYHIVLHGDIAPVPEPETYAMLLAGLALLGFAARRRKQNAA